MSLDILIREPGGIRRSGALVIDSGAVTETAGGIPELALGFVGAKAWLQGPVTLPNVTSTPIPFDRVLFDEGGFFDLSAGPGTTMATVPPGKGGKYLVVADGYFSNGPASLREVEIRRNGSQVVGVGRIAQQTGFVTVIVTEVVPLDPGDYLEMLMLHDSGGVLFAFGGSGESRTSFSLVRLGA